MTDLEMQIFKEKIIKEILSSNMTISMTYYILKDIMHDLEKAMQEQINRQKEEYLKNNQNFEKEETVDIEIPQEDQVE